MNERVTVIRPRRGWDLSELWEFRELLWVFASRDIKIRYKQTLLGAAWAVIQPLATVAVFALVFGRFAGMPSDGHPYVIFAFAAMVPWAYFSYALGGAAGSVVDQRAMITKIYFPRLILPIAPLMAGLVDLLIATGVLGGLMAWYGITPTARIAALPLFVLLAMASALSAGLWLSALNAHYRDFRHMMPFLLQIWFFATPIAYPLSVVPESWRVWFAVNPMVGVIEGFRWALLGGPEVPGLILATSSGMAAAGLIAGLAFFRRMERSFVDVV